MTGYILDPMTLETLNKVDITDYSLPIETAQAVNGSVTIPQNTSFNANRMVLYIPSLADRYFKISNTEQKTENQTKLNIADEAELLTDNFWGRTTTLATDFMNVFKAIFTTYGSVNIYDAGQYAPHFVGERTDPSAWSADVWNRLSQIPLDLTEFCDLQKGTGCYGSCASLLRIAARYGIISHVKAVNYRPSLGIKSYRYSFEIEPVTLESDTVVPIFFNDGHSEIKSETYDNSNILSALWVFGTGGSKVFYLKNDLSVGTNSAEQMPGSFGLLDTDAVIPSSSQMESILMPYAQEEFAKNSYGHKIEFYSDKVLHLGQPVKLALNRGILDTAISKVMLTSADERYLYTCGELPTTATDLITASSWKYGQRLPLKPRKGQLYIQS